MNKISIIIPVYNAERFLGKCLDSVLNQTFSDLEIICIDDNSTDSSPQILEAYQKKDSRIRILKNERNINAAESRNKGLDNAKGEYIYFLDADDYIDQEYLRVMYDKAVETGADILMNTNILTHSYGNVSVYVHPSMPQIPDKGCYMDAGTAVDKSFCVIWMRLFKRELLEKKHIRFISVKSAQDVIFNYITNVNASFIFAFHPEESYHYVIHGDSIVENAKKENLRDYAHMEAYSLIYDYLKKNGLLEQNKAKLFNVSGFFKVDTEEKFELYRSYFSKIKEHMNATLERYNAMDIFFAQSILSADSFAEYKSKYPTSVAIAFIKNGKKSK